MDEEELLELMNKIYLELDTGFKEISNDIENLKKDSSEDSVLLGNLNPKIKRLTKVQKNFAKQLKELKDKIEALSSSKKTYL